jgi:Tfp pilus assembly ATPase PilU
LRCRGRGEATVSGARGQAGSDLIKNAVKIHLAPKERHLMRTMTTETNTTHVDRMGLPNSDNTHLHRWLEQLVAQKGSDLLLVSGAPAAVRTEGVLSPLGESTLSGEEIVQAVLPAMAAHAREEYQQYGIADSSYRVQGLGRFRINLHRERGRAAATVRALPSAIPTLDELHLPPGVGALAKLQRGLVIIGGGSSP